MTLKIVFITNHKIVSDTLKGVLVVRFSALAILKNYLKEKIWILDVYVFEKIEKNDLVMNKNTLKDIGIILKDEDNRNLAIKRNHFY